MKSSDRYLVPGAWCELDGARLPVANLSVGGFFVASPQPPMAGQTLAMRLQVDVRAFSIVGKVTWVNRGPAPRNAELPTGFGVQITKIAFPDKLALLNLLKARTPAPRHDPS